MKKVLKWFGITAGILVGLLVIGAVALPMLLPLEKIKDLAAQQISKAINREVKVEKVSFNLFEGIKLNNLTVSNRPGFAKQNFISADSIVLRYAFWPIFKRQIIVKEISLVNPEILIEKGSSGEFNFSDMGGKSKSRTAEKPIAEKKDQGFSLIVDSFSIKNAKITYVDHVTKLKNEIKNANLKISGITLSLLKPIDFSFSAVATYQGKNIPISLAGGLRLDLSKKIASFPALNLKLAGEQANIAATASNWQAGPNIDFSISSKKLSLDPLLAIFVADQPKAKQKAKPGELTQKVNQALAKLPAKLKIHAQLDLENLTVLNFGVDKINAALSLAQKNLKAELKEIRLYEGRLSGLAKINLAAPGLSYTVKNLKLENFNAAPFSNAVVETFLTRLENYQDLSNKVFGRLDATLALSGQGVEASDIMANLSADGSLSLKDGELKRLKSLDAIADKIKTPALKQDLKISLLTADFSFANQLLDLKNLKLKDHDLNVFFDGGLDLKALKYVSGNRLKLRASPAATKELAREFNLLRDNEGWLEITLELTGSLKMPIPIPILDKPIEKVVGKIKAVIEAKKIEIVSQVSQEVEAKKAELKKEAEAKAEAEKARLKEEAKGQLKNLLKF